MMPSTVVEKRQPSSCGMPQRWLVFRGICVVKIVCGPAETAAGDSRSVMPVGFAEGGDGSAERLVDDSDDGADGEGSGERLASTTEAGSVASG
jgi:hypothetical protein